MSNLVIMLSVTLLAITIPLVINAIWSARSSKFGEGKYGRWCYVMSSQRYGVFVQVWRKSIFGLHFAAEMEHRGIRTKDYQRLEEVVGAAHHFGQRRCEALHKQDGDKEKIKQLSSQEHLSDVDRLR